VDRPLRRYFGESFARQHRVDPQPAIFLKRKHPIIPPGENTGLLRMQSERVTQADFTELLKSGALTIGAHDRAAPKLWVVNIDIFRRDIEIATNDKIDIFFFGQAIPQSRVPLQFIFVSRRTDRLPIWRVNGIDAHISNRRRNHSGLRIDNFIAKRRADLHEFRFRKNGDAVVRFLAMISGIVTGRLQRQHRKLFVGAFRFLQTNNIRCGTFKPGKQPVLPFPQ